MEIKVKGADVERIYKDVSRETGFSIERVKEVLEGYLTTRMRELVDDLPEKKLIYKMGVFKRRKRSNGRIHNNG